MADLICLICFLNKSVGFWLTLRAWDGITGHAKKLRTRLSGLCLSQQLSGGAHATLNDISPRNLGATAKALNPSDSSILSLLAGLFFRLLTMQGLLQLSMRSLLRSFVGTGIAPNLEQ